MRYAALDLLACPMCRHFPLKLYVFEEKTLVGVNIHEKPFCGIFCGFYNKRVGDVSKNLIDCNSCLSRDIVWGIIVCEKCWRWYPIIGGVALMYPDDLRLHTRIRVVEGLFIRRYRNKIPSDVIVNDPLKFLRELQNTF